jgi:thiol-disulfide isomerase/thioredoxin
MSKVSKYRVLVARILSPVAALICYAVVYMTLTELSRDREKDWLFRLSMASVAMTIPFLVTAALALQDRRSGPLSASAKAGLLVAVLSLGFTWKPINDGVIRWKQTRNLALRNVSAPAFDTPDIQGTRQRLQDQKGKVVLVNIWATWCGPCRDEMPKLDQIYRERRDQGFMIFGFSSEDAGLQRKFVQGVRVSYPLLTSSPGARPLQRHRSLPCFHPHRP